LLSTLSQQRSAHSHEGYNLLKCDEESQSPLKNCTLVLIDRTIDLFTPTAHDPSPPLAHRVLCTLQKAKNASLDVSLTQPLTSVLYPEDGESASDPLQMNSPLSAVSALPIHITPSIAPPFTPAACADDFMNAMFAMSEESGKTILYEELRKTVTEAQGTLPPSKKRGIGAELLGLVNAIISSPSSNSLLPSLSHNEELCVESSGLLSWCLALIDSLQRSSTKQLQAHLTSLLAPPMGAAGAVPLLQCLSSYEMKSTRERVLLSSLTQQHQLSLLSYPIITEIILESCGLTPGSSTSSSCSLPPSGVVDLEHLFQMLLGYFSTPSLPLFSSGLIDFCSAFSLMESIIEPEQSSERHLQEAVAMIRTALTTYLINFWSLSVLSSLSLLDFRCSPIIEATRLKLLREEILKDIAQYRALVSSLSPYPSSLVLYLQCMETETTSDDHEEKEEIVASLRQRLQLEVEDIVLNFVDILREISSLRSSSLPSPLSSSTTAPSASVSAPRDEIFTFSINDSEEALPSLTSVPKHRVVKRAASEEVSPSLLYFAHDLSSESKATWQSRERICDSSLPIPHRDRLQDHLCHSQGEEPPPLWSSCFPSLSSARPYREPNIFNRKSWLRNLIARLWQVSSLSSPPPPLSLSLSMSLSLSQRFLRLGLASGVAKESHPAQHPILVIFVIGGVSVLEVKQVQEVLNSDSGYDQTQVLIGSNNLCSPADLYENIWTPASYLAHQ
jgi:hypothetical protein